MDPAPQPIAGHRQVAATRLYACDREQGASLRRVPSRSVGAASSQAPAQACRPVTPLEPAALLAVNSHRATGADEEHADEVPAMPARAPIPVLPAVPSDERAALRTDDMLYPGKDHTVAQRAVAREEVMNAAAIPEYLSPRGVGGPRVGDAARVQCVGERLA